MVALCEEEVVSFFSQEQPTNSPNAKAAIHEMIRIFMLLFLARAVPSFVSVN
jgi:hypothetical protein